MKVTAAPKTTHVITPHTHTVQTAISTALAVQIAIAQAQTVTAQGIAAQTAAAAALAAQIGKLYRRYIHPLI